MGSLMALGEAGDSFDAAAFIGLAPAPPPAFAGSPLPGDNDFPAPPAAFPAPYPELVLHPF